MRDMLLAGVSARRPSPWRLRYRGGGGAV